MTKKAAGKAPAKDGIAALSSIDDLMAMALAMESEAAERYAEFAEVMEAHNNREVAELFGKMARIENLHAQQIRDKMGWTDAPPGGARAYRWEGMEGPETGDHGELHYLMTPHHALKIARMNEQRAHRFYEKNGFEVIPRENLPPSFPVMAVDSRFYRLVLAPAGSTGATTRSPKRRRRCRRGRGTTRRSRRSGRGRRHRCSRSRRCAGAARRSAPPRRPRPG